MTWQIPRWTGWVVWRKSEEPRVTHRWRFRTELLVMPFIEMGKLKGLWMAGRKWLLWKKWNTYYVYYVWDVSEAWKWKCLEAFRYANLDLTLGGGVCVCVCVLGWGCGWTQRPLEPFLISPEENWSLLLLHTSLFCIDFSHGICNFLKSVTFFPYHFHLSRLYPLFKRLQQSSNLISFVQNLWKIFHCPFLG